jgi:hypothetical protein
MSVQEKMVFNFFTNELRFIKKTTFLSIPLLQDTWWGFVRLKFFKNENVKYVHATPKKSHILSRY